LYLLSQKKSPELAGAPVYGPFTTMVLKGFAKRRIKAISST
jgi:hypothetical protein